jgi:hypothetical protein
MVGWEPHVDEPVVQTLDEALILAVERGAHTSFVVDLEARTHHASDSVIEPARSERAADSREPLELAFAIVVFLGRARRGRRIGQSRGRETDSPRVADRGACGPPAHHDRAARRLVQRDVDRAYAVNKQTANNETSFDLMAATDDGSIIGVVLKGATAIEHAPQGHRLFLARSSAASGGVWALDLPNP